MSDCSGWCQSLTSGVIVAVLVLGILALIAWVVIDTINARIRRIINSVSSLVTPFIEYIRNVVEYIKNNSPEIRDNIAELSKKISLLLNKYIKNVDIETMNKILIDKIDAYKSRDIASLKSLNTKLSEALSKNSETRTTIKSLMDELDEFILEFYESVSGSELYQKVNTFISQLMNLFR